MFKQPLHHDWTVRAVGDLSEVPQPLRDLALPAQVPGCLTTDLLRAGKIEDPYLDENEFKTRWIGHTDWQYTLVFDAELMAPGLVPLNPCPDYTIAFGTHTVTRQLNCSRVPYFASFVHPDGRVTAFRPVLPAGTVVVFRMQVRVPDDPGEQKVLWALDGPQTAPGFNGTVTVRPTR